MVQLHGGAQISASPAGQPVAAMQLLSPFCSHVRANRDPGTDATVMETYLALPGAEYIYSEYDLGIIADILTTAEHNAANLARKGKGGWHPSSALHAFSCMLACDQPCHMASSNPARPRAALPSCH